MNWWGKIRDQAYINYYIINNSERKLHFDPMFGIIYLKFKIDFIPWNLKVIEKTKAWFPFVNLLTWLLHDVMNLISIENYFQSTINR